MPETCSQGRSDFSATPSPALHVDATAGVAGDMLLGALLDAGADLARVQAAIACLDVPGLGLAVQRTRRAGLTCTRAVVHAPDEPGIDRGPAEVHALLRTSGLAAPAARFAAETFELLAAAEAAVHGVEPEQVHFHEVGAADALADVVGTAAALDDLGLLDAQSTATCSPLAAGSGTADTAHGAVPLPAPAVLEIAARHGLALTGTHLPGERSTPTGAALLATLAEPGPAREMTVRAVGSGAGARDTPELPNITRVVLGAATADRDPSGPSRPILVVEATVDDLDPRLWPAVLSALRQAGAWDCWTSAAVGRHGRPSQVLTALCAPELRDAVVAAVFRHTSTLGVRWSEWQRATLPRRSYPVAVDPDGEHEVAVKVGTDSSGNRAPSVEIGDAERAAGALGLPLRTVCERALAAYRRRYPDGPEPAPDG